MPVEKVGAIDRGDLTIEMMTDADFDWTPFFGSQSEADLSLVTKLAIEYENDEDKIVEEFEKSPLAGREKWNREDYRTRTLVTAMKTAEAIIEERAYTDDDLLASLEKMGGGIADPAAEAKPAEQESPISTVVEIPNDGKAAPAPKIYPFPESALYGWLGEEARLIGTPLGFAYPAWVTAFAPRIQGFPKQVRPTVYCALIGPVHCGKSETIRRVLASIHYAEEDTVKTTVPASDRGVITCFGMKQKKDDPNAIPSHLQVPKTKLLVQDELRNMLAKAMIQGSSLPSVLNTLWYEDECGVADKSGEYTARLRLSILGALKTDDATDFGEVFAKGATSGLYDRFQICIGDKAWDYTYWEPPAEPSMRCPSGPLFTDRVFEQLREWRSARDGRKRMAEIVLRHAYITAAANQDKTITDECITAAFSYGEWLESIKTKYKAGLGDDKQSRACAAILDVP